MDNKVLFKVFYIKSKYFYLKSLLHIFFICNRSSSFLFKWDNFDKISVKENQNILFILSFSINSDLNWNLISHVSVNQNFIGVLTCFREILNHTEFQFVLDLSLFVRKIVDAKLNIVLFFTGNAIEWFYLKLINI